MGKRDIVTTAINVRDGKDPVKIEETADFQKWPRGLASIFFRRKRIDAAIRKIQKEGTPRDMSRFMRERRIGTRG